MPDDVERVAREIFEDNNEEGPDTWDTIEASLRGIYLSNARAAITAIDKDGSQYQDVAEAARFVFMQMTEIAQSDGPPLIQDWARIDRLGLALKALDAKKNTAS